MDLFDKYLESISPAKSEKIPIIDTMLPADQAGVYSSDPRVREQAKKAAEYPWEGLREGEDNDKYPKG